MKYSDRDRTIALAGLLQTAYLVDRIAHTSIADSDAMEASLRSLFSFDTESVEMVYGSVGCVVTGLKQIHQQLTSKFLRGDVNVNVIRYFLGLVYLERKLISKDVVVEQVKAGIENAFAQTEHFPILHPNVLSNLANLYSETVSSLGQKIIINGNRNHLTNQNNANKIRSLLLAGVRSAVLWRQCGGNKWQLVFYHKALLKQTEILLQEAKLPLH